MEIESVKVIKVKKEYMNSMEGQNKLVNIINGDINCEELIKYEISDYTISEIFREDYYIKNYQDDKEYKKERAVHALLFGGSDFNYTYSDWETELGIENQAKEQIAERVVQMWGIAPENKEEIEMIASSFVNHDNLCLRYMSVENIERVISDLEHLDVLSICRSIEKELNSQGISFDAIDEGDIEFINSLKGFFKEAIKDRSGIVYALSDSCDFCEED
ncbi:hypothetical protein Ccar_09410 [Clostridium carboxidivorans P7]|uniref:DUF4375 domain-containing protein n=1 Tax=Clostridium carboxidivorans P7 TaxID=536227 RepID=C6PRM0_9CLOT|nr:hypothetical protein [Clostridium carboxidivorans]AKN31053.1 hypothetical protein Ccar_09410 [Clostridium carboxidivorans P7]EET88063.1 conserved hypothetical protein [Clostridium carboxidivorans P7]EFG88681.1 hypothetical protein CLCAR_1426 [Clostridium carboxidivorans P7]